jgi:4a-hydroxytetrahydrobiopterin dehydratase
MSDDLAQKSCIPCQGGTPPLTRIQIETYASQIHTDWQLVQDHHLQRDYKFKNFQEALAFVNRVGTLAEAENHHPDVYLAWGHVQIKIWTHKIDGLTESDFIFAAKVDRL